jgi:hypothetical protein
MLKGTILIAYIIITITVFSQDNKAILNRFDGEIFRIDSVSYGFDDKVMFVINSSVDFKNFFETGLLYPDLILNARNLKPLKFHVFDSTIILQTRSETNKSLNNIYQGDSLTISDIELFKLNTDSMNIKRFRFLVFEKRLANPSEYFIDLKNDNAAIDMDIGNFIKGSELMDIYRGSRLI